MTLRRHIALLLLFIAPFLASAQTYGNEWIDYSQNYYSFQVFENGIYKLDYAALNASGVPLGSFQSENIQIFGKEKEIPIHVEDGGDSSIDPGDYVLFYAERNDGWLDSTIFLDSSTIGNPAYSLYNDTLLYFFTWNTGTSNSRYVVETDVNFGAYASVADYIIHKDASYYFDEYHEGVKESDASSSFFTAGEGWGKTKLNGAGGGITVNLSASTSFPYTGPGAPNATFKGLSISASNANASGTFNHHLKWLIGSSNTEIHDAKWVGYDQNIANANFSSTLLSNGNTPIKFQIVDDLGAATDYQAYQYFSVEYPRQPNFNGASSFDFDVINDPQGKIRLDISSAGYNFPIMLVHGDTPRIVPFLPNGGFHSALIPNSGNGLNQSVIYKDSSMIQNIVSVDAVNGSGVFTDYSSMNLENALIMIYHPDLQPASYNYRDYRASSAGANYDTLLGNVEELYLQFGGGVRKHVNGVRRFAHYVYNNSTQKPVGLFLMAKGIREADFNITSSDGPGTRQHAGRFALSLIPSFGQPSSDVCLTAGLEGDTLWVPLIPTGRISARSNTELQDYLDKVVEYEIAQDPLSIYDSPNKDWQKQVIHFAGGSDLAEQNLFRSYMNALETKISDSLFGANVLQVYKSSSNPLDPTVLADVTDRISQGVSIMSYFGHASGTSSGFEINLDEPANWNNQGKYPVMLVNSCYNGNIFQWTNSKSEEFVQVANHGAIGYIASVGLGFSSYLNLYSQSLYTRFGRSEYGSTLGSMMKSNISILYIPPGANSLRMETTCTQMVLNGDPMLKLNTHEKPEIEITPQSVSFLPTNLDLTVDSIEMFIAVKNLGQSVTDTFDLIVERNFPNSSVDSVYIFSFPELHYVDTVSFKMPLQPNISIGNNIFNIRVDIPSIIDEQYDEINNNQLISTLFINIDGITPVIPYEFAVVPNDSVTVIGSTTDPIADFETYRFEIDTVDFEGTVPQSGEYRYALVSGLGGAKEVNPSEWLSVSGNNSMPLVCEDSVVYFWRVSIAGDTTWQESSFQHITGKTGWGQDHFYQFKKNGFYNIGYNRVDRKREFVPTVKELVCDVNSATWAPNIYYNAFYIGGELKAYGVEASLSPKFHVVVIDPVTLEPWKTKFGTENPNNDFGNNNTDLYFSWKYFTFLQHDPVQLDSMQSMITNHVPDGHYLLIYTPMTTNYDTINYLDSINFYNTFAALGSDSIVPGLPNRPFAFFTKKGDTSTVVEELTQIQGGEIQLVADLIGSDNSGQEQSTLIGPSTKWGNVYWKQDPEEVASADTTRLTISAYDINGTLQTTIDTLFTLNDSLIDLNAIVDATIYPYIDLNASYEDTASFTPAQIDRWHVLFDPLPEAAIDGTNQYTWSILSDTLEEGQDVEFAVDVKNIFSVDMDSLLITYWVEDAAHTKHFISYPRQDSLLVGETLRDTISFSTVGLGGINSFWMEVNPYVNGSFFVTDQPEQQHFNNLLQIPFFVNPDEVNPILDVTFNGNHILDGDIVDPYSEILITLKDDNEFLIMDDISDTTLFGVYLTDPSGLQVRIPFEDISTGQTVMQWIPANSQNKRFKIIWPAAFEDDGTYTLFVQGADRSGNISGDIEYKISFDVIHASSITRMMNYPNPFSTSTRFVFTLTGSEVPDEVIIQIMTISGKVVREITEDELGLIQIGRNITEYAWDGTDEFGDPLANGVYLYRVKAQINGENIEHRDSGADQYFKKDFGKMYLLR